MKSLAAALLVLAALPAAAQWRRFGDPEWRPTGYIGAGASAPTNPFASRLHSGWNVAAGAGAKYGRFAILVDAMYNEFRLTRSALARTGARRGYQSFWAVTLDPVFHVNPRGPVDFYLTGGGGVYGQFHRYNWFDGGGFFFDYDDVYVSRQIVKPGANLGAGLAFNLGNERAPKIFLEARYHRMFTRGSGVSLVPVTIGFRF